MSQLNPINPADAPPGWRAVEPPEKYRAPDADLTGACKEGCEIYGIPGRAVTFNCHYGDARCLPKNRTDGRFVHFRKGPATYGNEED